MTKPERTEQRRPDRGCAKAAPLDGFEDPGPSLEQRVADKSVSAGAAGVEDNAGDLEALFLRHDQRRHVVDLRLSVPWFGRGLYLVILGGSELRSRPRLRRERDRHPLLTLGNMLLVVSLVAIAYAIALVALVVFQGMAGGL